MAQRSARRTGTEPVVVDVHDDLGVVEQLRLASPGPGAIELGPADRVIIDGGA